MGILHSQQITTGRLASLWGQVQLLHNIHKTNSMYCLFVMDMEQVWPSVHKSRAFMPSTFNYNTLHFMPFMCT